MTLNAEMLSSFNPLVINSILKVTIQCDRKIFPLSNIQGEAMAVPNPTVQQASLASLLACLLREYHQLELVWFLLADWSALPFSSLALR